MDNALLDPFEKLLEDLFTPQAVRAIEAGGPAEHLWQPIEDSGYLDALVPDARGGSGLTLTEVHPLFEACGRLAVPLPVAETMAARALLAHAGLEAQDGPGAIALGQRNGTGDIVCPLTAYAATAAWVLVAVPPASTAGSPQVPAPWFTLPASAAQRTVASRGALAATLCWPARSLGEAAGTTTADLRTVQASLLAAQAAGAMVRLFRMTLQHANDRIQFGKAIGKFQAIQHQIAIMAEHTAVSRTAARMGCESSSYLPAPGAAAIAKAVTSEAAPAVAAIAHAVHGAIGITEEFDLQLFTRRLHEWRLCAGSESYWYERAGAALLADGATSTLDFIRSAGRTAPTHSEMP